MLRSILIAVLFAGLFLSACEKSSDNEPQTPVDPGDVTALAESNQALGWSLFAEEQKAQPNENVLISPFSIQTALNMATNGAQGATLEEMLDYMDVADLSVDQINQLHHDLTALLAEQSGHPQVTVSNRYFYDGNRMSVKTPFLQALENHYDAGSDNLDFSDVDNALSSINNWVSNSTDGRIDQILEQITPLDVAFLINAIHFKSDWATGFDPDFTSTAAFTRLDGTTVPVDFISADRDYTFNQTALHEIVDVPFRDSTFSLTYIKPSSSNTDPDWRYQITPETYRDFYTGMQYTRAIGFFPKLKLAYKNDLVESLKKLGVQTAFSPFDADFTPMGTASNNIYIKQIAHKSVLEVDEKGAEGAAVTSIGFAQTSLPPTFRFDEPFVLVLRHIPTNAMLFVGFVADPS